MHDVILIDLSLDFLGWVRAREQARRSAASDGVVGRAGVRDAVPNPDGAELRVQLHHHGAAGHPLVARARLLDARHALRAHRHPPQARRALPLPG